MRIVMETKGSVIDQPFAIRGEGLFTGEAHMNQRTTELHWRTLDEGKQYSLPLVLTPEDDGGYSVVCPFLPGAVSQGDTIDETISNAKEALGLLIETYQTENMKIPWRHDRITLVEKQIKEWIIVDV